MKPRPPRSTGPTPRGRSGRDVDRRPRRGDPARRPRRARIVRRRTASTDQARPIPTSANPAAGCSHSAASRSSSRAAAKRLIASTAATGRVTRSAPADTGSSGPACIGAIRARGAARARSTTVTGPSRLDDPPLRDARAAQQERAQRPVRLVQAAGLVGHQPARDDLVERAEPGDARQPRVERRDRALRDRLVEVAGDHLREPLVERVRLVVEGTAGTERIEEEQPGHRAVARERGEDGPERRVRLGDRVGLGSYRPVHLRREAVGGRAHQLPEDRLLGREVEVDATLARLGGGRDLVHRGVAVAAPRERVERRVQDLLAPRAALLGLRAAALLVAHARRCPSCRRPDEPTDQSVCF